MTDIIEQIEYSTNVPLIEKGDKVEGGEGGPANKQAQVLANRTAFLKEGLDAIPNSISVAMADHEGGADPHPQYIDQAKANSLYVTLQGANLPNGYVQLDLTGKIPASLLNFVSTTYKVVADKAARLVINSSDDLQIIVQQDEDRLYYLNAGMDPTIEANWYAGQSATVNGVASIFGRTGTILAAVGDYNADQITETVNRKFVSDAEKANYAQKQDKLVNAINVVTLFGKPLLAAGDLTFSPSQLGAAEKSHTHIIGDIPNLPAAMQSMINNGYEAGSGVSIGVNPVTSKLTISANPDTVEAPGYVVVERPNSLAGQLHDFSFESTTRYSLNAFALKKIVGLAAQVYPFDTFTAGAFVDYNVTPYIQAPNGLGCRLINGLTPVPSEGFYKAGTIDLTGLQSFSLATASANASIIPAMTNNFTPSGYVASASAYRGSGEEAYKAFDGIGNDDWFNSAGANGSWLRIDMPIARAVSSYSIENRPEGNQSISSWQLQGSNDGGATWVTLHVGSNSINTANYVGTYTVPAANVKAYSSYRIYVLGANGGTSYSSISQLKLFESPAKLLLKGSDGKWFKPVNGVLTEVSPPSTTTDFETNGVANSGKVLPAQWNDRTSFDIYSSQTSVVTLTAIPNAQIALPKVLRSLGIFSLITALTANATISGTSKICLGFTKDGVEYFAFKNGDWTSIGGLTLDTNGGNKLLTNGNTPAEITALTSAQIDAFFNGDYRHFGVAYAFSYAADADVGVVQTFRPIGNYSDTWQFQAPAEVNINRRGDGITFKTIGAGDYKLVYQIP